MARSRQSRRLGHTDSEQESLLPHELDIVALLVPVAGQPAGTLATVLDVDPDRRILMLEIAAPDGQTVATPSVSADDVRPVWTASPASGQRPTH